MPSLSGKGGHRHFPKPLVDSDLIFKVFAANEKTLRDLGSYESVSRQHAVDPAGLVKLYDLLKGIIKVERSAEVHAQALKKALLRILHGDPSLNNTKFRGEVWVNLRQERLTCCLAHLRRLVRDDDLGLVAAKLTSPEFCKMQELVNMVDLSNRAVEDVEPALKKAKQDPDPQTPLNKEEAKDDDVSLDSGGFPQMFGSPAPSNKAPSLPVHFLRRKGARIAGAVSGSGSVSESAQLVPVETERDDLQKALGYQPTTKENNKHAKTHLEKGKAMKKPSAAAKALPSQVSLKKDGRKPWLKLRKTMAKKPARAYIMGTTEEHAKLSLIVEVPETWSKQYEKIIDQILAALKKDSLTKREALDMRLELVHKYT